MRSIIYALVLMLCLVAFSGCLGIFEEEEGVSGEDGPEEGEGEANGEEDGDPENGQANGTGEETPLARLNGTVLVDGNESAADVNISLQSQDEAEAQGLNATTDEEGQYVFEELAAGSYLFSINATCCAAFNETVEIAEGENMTLDVDLESLQLGPDPEGGEVEGTATGATGAVLATDDIFELNDGGHARIELIVEFDDPLAQQGQEFSFRLELPDGGEENYDAENGEPIITESVMEGQYDMVVWPVVAGSYDWSVTWCAYTDTHCDDV